jgi:hypothetical protein
MTSTEARRARNQVIFREANEQIAAKADEVEVGDAPIPFLCECPDPSCTELILLVAAEYESVRAHPRHFLACPGHERDGALVVRSEEGYCVFEKTGVGGLVAEAEAGNK